MVFFENGIGFLNFTTHVIGLHDSLVVNNAPVPIGQRNPGYVMVIGQYPGGSKIHTPVQYLDGPVLFALFEQPQGQADEQEQKEREPE